MGDKTKDEPPAPEPGWTPWIRALCILTLAGLATIEIRTPGESFPAIVYTGVIGLGIGIQPAYIKRAASAALKALSDG